MNNPFSTSFSRYNDSAFLAKAEIVVVSMVNNIHFPAPTPSMAILQEAVKTFGDAITAAADGDDLQMARKKAQRKVVESMLRKLAGHLSKMANGNMAMLATCGLDLKKPKVIPPPVEPPQSIEAINGRKSGEIRVSVSAVKGVRSYVHEYTTDPVSDTSVWIQVTVRRCKHLFTGLQPGKKYWFRTAVVGPGNVKLYSAVIAVYVR